MTKYLISFDDGAMTFPEEEMPAVGEAAHQVVRAAQEAGVGSSAAGWRASGRASWLPTGRSPTARPRRPRLLSEGSRSSTCPHAKRHWSGPPSSPSPAAAHRRSGRSCSTRSSEQRGLAPARAMLAFGCSRLNVPGMPIMGRHPSRAGAATGPWRGWDCQTLPGDAPRFNTKRARQAGCNCSQPIAQRPGGARPGAFRRAQRGWAASGSVRRLGGRFGARVSHLGRQAALGTCSTRQEAVDTIEQTRGDGTRSRFTRPWGVAPATVLGSFVFIGLNTPCLLSSLPPASA